MMKQRFYLGLLIGCWMVAGCKKTQEARVAAQPTILQYIAGDPQLTYMNAAIARCELDTFMSSGGPFTLFCPVDSAWVAAGWTKDRINTVNPDSLSMILRYGMLSGRFSTTDVVGFFTEQVSSLDSAYQPFVEKNYYGFFINGIPVMEDVELGDGTVQKMGQFNNPPGGTVLQMIDSLPELSIFAAVVNQVPQFQSLFSTYSTGQSSFYKSSPGFTVMVPTNDAFAASLFPTTDVVMQTDPNTLFNVFGPYVLNGFRFTSDFLGGYSINPNTSRLLQFFVSSEGAFEMAKDGVTLLVANSGSGTGGQAPPHIIRPNIVATNGIIQEIDQVFY